MYEISMLFTTVAFDRCRPQGMRKTANFAGNSNGVTACLRQRCVSGGLSVLRVTGEARCLYYVPAFVEDRARA